MGELTFYLIVVSFAIVLGSFQYGYHIGELNTPKSVMSCENLPDDTIPHDNSLPRCIPMNEAKFGLLTSILNLGGLIGSLLSSRVADAKGRRWTLLCNNLFLFFGPIIMGFGNSYFVLVIGRLIVGIGCGVTSVVVPMYLAEISPIEYRGVFGVMNQLGIVIVVSIIQSILLGFSVESPKYIASKIGGYQSAKRVLQQLRGKAEVEEEIGGWKQVAEEERLEGLIDNQQNDNDLNSQQQQSLPSSSQASQDNIEERISTTSEPVVVFHARNQNTEDINFWVFVNNPYYKPALRVLILLQLTQQFSGINAVINYSTTILGKILPTSSDLITVYISIVNVIMTLVSAYLIDKSGRRTLSLYSMSLMSLASAMLAFGISYNLAILSSISIIGFVAAFAIGLGPIPFLIIPEIVDTHFVATASSLGLSINWTSNFLISSLFLEIREILGGRVFYIFTAYLLVAFIIGYLILPETKAKTVEEVWHGWSGKYVKK
ncbi:general substrate transporter [Rhizophagus clarus]|uniref:General substrate transporter n=1 Tax=Rhizophagus clarus TaxID=94130 RepID=A0A8H3QNE8_9GLOM|nr:general substrate transporter [Rhizophagus clarus]